MLKFHQAKSLKFGFLIVLYSINVPHLSFAVYEILTIFKHRPEAGLLDADLVAIGGASGRICMFSVNSQNIGIKNVFH
jgi:hypothetical protein